MPSRPNAGTVRLDRVTAILQWAVSPQMRTRFGIPERVEDAKGFEAAYSVVRRLFHQVTGSGPVRAWQPAAASDQRDRGRVAG